MTFDISWSWLYLILIIPLALVALLIWARKKAQPHVHPAPTTEKDKTDDHGHHGHSAGLKESTYQTVEFISRVIMVLGAIAVAWVLMNGAEKVAKVAKQASPPRLYVVNPTVVKSSLPSPAVSAEYPAQGEGVATKSSGIKCWLDPHRTSTRPSAPAEYVFADDTSIRYTDLADGLEKNSNIKKWYKMPAGKYTVYPLGEKDELRFRWWMN